MNIVIDIPEEAYKLLQTDGVDWLGAEHILNAVANGKPHETVTEFADRCRECGREKVLDEIRAEIDKLPDLNPDYEMDKTIHVSKWAVHGIIDKYRVESEEV